MKYFCIVNVNLGLNNIVRVISIVMGACISWPGVILARHVKKSKKNQECLANFKEYLCYIKAGIYGSV